MCGGANSSTLFRAGSNATTAMSQAPVFASSTIFATAVYSTSATGTPARASPASTAGVGAFIVVLGALPQPPSNAAKTPASSNAILIMRILFGDQFTRVRPIY